MINIKDLSYRLANGTELINSLSFSLDGMSKVGLIGANGIGKSSILKLIVGDITPTGGEITKNNLNISYLPQNFNKLNFKTVADVFGLEKQAVSLARVDEGTADLEDYVILDGYWDCNEIITRKLEFFNLKLNPLQEFSSLSGGEKVKVVLPSIISKQTNFLILDEPTNNMDCEGKAIFHDFVKNWDSGILLVSHDRELLTIMDKIIELRKLGSGNTEIYSYGCNFVQYLEQKKLESTSLEKKYDNAEKELNKQKQQLMANREIREKRVKQGKKKLENSKYIKLALDSKINKSEKKSGQLLKRDVSNLNKIDSSLKSIDAITERKGEIYFKLKNQAKVSDKIIFELNNLNFSYGDRQIFSNFNITIRSKSRIAINGRNGSGKSTLLKIIANNFSSNFAFLDQEQNFLVDERTMLENIVSYSKLSELEARDMLAKFAFRTDSVNKLVRDISGGERLRVALAYMFSKNPDLLLLDELTNNLDLDSVNFLENILKQYTKALVVVSHDNIFKETVEIKEIIKI